MSPGPRRAPGRSFADAGGASARIPPPGSPLRVVSISPVIRRAERFQDLLAIPGGDGPYVFTRMFRESDRRERRRSRKNFRLLKRIDGMIREIAEADERVLFVTDARGTSFWERWVLGWRRAVVITDRRLLLLQLDSLRRPRMLHRHVPFGALTSVSEGRWGRLEVGTRAEEQIELRGLRREDRAVVAEALRTAREAPSPIEAGSGIENLCPHCHRGIPGRPRTCPHCLRELRRGWIPPLLSLFVPGLGNHRLGYRGFAVLELAGAAALWSGYYFGLDAWGLSDLRRTVGPGWIFLVVHGADALFTWYVARRGVYPAGED